MRSIFQSFTFPSPAGSDMTQLRRMRFTCHAVTSSLLNASAVEHVREPCLLANTSFWSPQKTILLSTRLVPPSHCTIYNHTHIFLSLQIQIRCD